MRIALDATYSVDAQPSGIAVYSRRLLAGMAETYPDEKFIHCYRPKQLRRAPRTGFANVRRRALLPLPTPLGADIFHALNQRVDRRYARSIVATFHDLFVMTGEYSSPEFRRRFTEQAREAARRADLIITVSQFTADQVHELLDVERSRLRVIPHGVDRRGVDRHGIDRHGADRRAEIGSEKQQPLVLFVGALQIRKNIERLVEAFEGMPEQWRLLLAGAPNGYGADGILARIERSPARKRIEIAGYVSAERLEELYSQASIFVFPSLDEGFGIPVLEAMAWGIPVITSNTSALGELGGGAALLVNPRETAEIHRALERLADDSEIRRELAEKGRARAAEFSWEKAIRQTYSVYCELKSDRN